ncbi:MAG: carboxysome shell protein [Bilophila wadsworthia]
MEEKARIIQELVPGKQVTIAHLIAHPDEDLAKKMGVPGAEAVGILTLSPREAAMIAGDFATKAASVQIGFVDRFTAHWSFGLNSQRGRSLTLCGKTLHDVLGFATCENQGLTR